MPKRNRNKATTLRVMFNPSIDMRGSFGGDVKRWVREGLLTRSV